MTGVSRSKPHIEINLDNSSDMDMIISQIKQAFSHKSNTIIITPTPANLFLDSAVWYNACRDCGVSIDQSRQLLEKTKLKLL